MTNFKFKIKKLFSKLKIRNWKLEIPIFYKNGRGYTIIETLIAMSIFITVSTLGVHAFVNALGAQRTIIMEQAVAQNVSFALEFMSRQMRTAVRSNEPPDNDCLPLGETFRSVPPSLIFLNDDGNCIEFRTQGGSLQYTSDATVPTGSREYIDLVTSDLVSIDDFTVILDGETQGDGIQPRVTISIEASGIPQSPKDPQNILLRAQTSVSTRLLDI